MANADVGETPKKPRKVENFYVNTKGERAARPWPDTVSIGKKFLDSGHEEIVLLEKLPPAQRIQTLAFGLHQVGSNAYGGMSTEDDMISAFQVRMETILGGAWASERESGDRTGDLVEAFAQARAEDGKPVTDEWRKMVAEKLTSEEITPKSLKDNPKIRAKFDAIKAKRAQERATASAAKAGADVQLPDIE